MKNTTEQAYDCWPDRLFLVGRNGKIAWKSGHGPWGFRPNDLEKALKIELKAAKSTPKPPSKQRAF